MSSASTRTITEKNLEVSRQTVRLFPGWWTHIGAQGETRPFYRVEVEDQAELALAKRLKPDCVRAEFTLSSGSRSGG